jgi:hypothetical protein
MSIIRVLSIGVAVGFFLGACGAAAPSTAQAAWVNGGATQFQVGGALDTINLTLNCAEGGTSLALVQGSKLAGVDAVVHPAVLVVSCLDGESETARKRLHFISTTDGTVVKQIDTTVVPSNGWRYLVHRQDKGDLLGCGDNGALYSIDFSQTNNIADGTATPLASPPPEATSCKGLAWDADADMIHLAVDDEGIRIIRFQEGIPALFGTVAAPATCVTNGLAISGGVQLMACENDATIRRLDKSSGIGLGAHGTLTAAGLPPLGDSDAGLGGLACDPVTFHKDATGKDLFTDALWSRPLRANGDALVALEFPAYTCGMPPNSVVIQSGAPYSPLAAGLGATGEGPPGEIPRAECFDANGQVIDADGDGLPDCWEASGSGVDFDGDGTVDLQLCVQVNTNGDGVTLTTDCASSSHKDLFVEIDWMQDHKPDPKALSQTQSPDTLVNNVPVGVKSVREAFAAAPVPNPDATSGIRLHMLVDEQVTFTPLSGPPTSHVNQVAFTPCTGPAINAISQAEAVDFDTVKAGNFGTATERTGLNALNVLNAKRLAFRYVLFAHNVVGPPPTGGGSNSSGCGEIGGDDAVITLGSFALTTVTNVSHRRGTTDQQAGTFMHEFGHLLGFGHGGLDSINCKPNYRSVMSYPRQFAGSPIANRRLDYSRSADPVIANDPNNPLSGLLNEASLNEGAALGTDPSRLPIPPSFPLADSIAFGPNAWTVVPANAASINWNRSKNTTPQNPVSANTNAGATAGCDGAGALLEGQDDWSNVLYRPSAAINFAGGETPTEMTSDQEQAFYLGRDTDGNGVGDGTDCGGLIPDPPDGTTAFSCTHRIDIKPSYPVPKVLALGAEANVKIAIFSERNGVQVWNAPVQVKLNDMVKFPLTLSVESVTVLVKVNNKGQGTCSAQDVADPITGLKDGIKDLNCQFPTGGLPSGTHFGIVSGFFFDPLTGEDRAFSARQEVTIVR